jgi:glyoxylase-like metal-dependent hydrolase (beta-lactamase superfamily II)
VAEGIPILTHENNVEFLSNLGNPRTLLADDDLLKEAGTEPMIEGVGDSMVIEDDTMRLELYHVQDLGHTDGMLIAYLPESRILFQADFTLPQPGAAPNDFVRSLGENVRRLGLDFERYYAVHDAGVLQTRETFDTALAVQ